jgi:hypothetical protein
VSDNQATLTIDGKTIDLPVKSGTIGPDVIDIRKLYGQSGKFTYDPALPPPQAATAPSPTSTVTKACCCIAAIRSASWPNTPASWK